MIANVPTHVVRSVAVLIHSSELMLLLVAGKGEISSSESKPNDCVNQDNATAAKSGWGFWRCDLPKQTVFRVTNNDADIINPSNAYSTSNISQRFIGPSVLTIDICTAQLPSGLYSKYSACRHLRS